MISSNPKKNAISSVPYTHVDERYLFHHPNDPFDGVSERLGESIETQLRVVRILYIARASQQIES